MIWTPEADALLVSLWNEGGSLQYVASGLQRAGYVVTRNSIAGRRHRIMGQAKFARPSHSIPTKVASPEKRPPTKRSTSHMTIPKNKPMTVSEINSVITEHIGIDYLDQVPDGCKAILDKPRSGPWHLQKVCGLPRCEGSPYCVAHFRLYHNLQPMPRRERG